MKLLQTWKYQNESPVRDIYIAIEHKEYCFCLVDSTQSGHSDTIYNHLSDIASGIAERITHEDTAYITP